MLHPPDRVTVGGKFLRLGPEKYYVKGLSYGPFAANSDGESLPERAGVLDDLAQIRAMGANTIRVYHPPPRWLLDEALEHGLRVFIDVPWEKHRCFFEDWEAQQQARRHVRETAESLGNHPGLFAISVVNEFPVDIVRYYGQRRVERFVSELLDTVKQAAPECLATFVNYPTTEFLQPIGCDFDCFNVYLHDLEVFGQYLDRLQHIAGDRPLVLGEYGIDSLREGEEAQSRLVARHVERVFRHGLAGSFVFAFTDDWFTGGQQIDDWKFGMTRADRSEKQVAGNLRDIWSRVPHIGPSEELAVSVVVCSYNGASTLRACLESLMALNYPDFEVILVDDGSTDCTPEIAAEFPQVTYIRQANEGLSVARNVGAHAARGEIVAYTDSDCVVDRDWLNYLVRAMREQNVNAIGGPNIAPPDDGWIAQCVASSPGSPSHVLLDDRYAEHVPGCNMAFRRNALLRLGGFDPQFRQAGDDVDICWRFLDAEMNIGYAAGAMVWHHRRATVKAYLKQQSGYGRSEAMVHFKHPQRFSVFGNSRWQGVIYGDGAVGLPVLPPMIYHGPFGSAPFQTIYNRNQYSPWAWVTSLEWHVLAILILALAILYPWLVAVSMGMWLCALGASASQAIKAPLPARAPGWCRPLVWGLYFLQPIVRGWARHRQLLRSRKLPEAEVRSKRRAPLVKRISSCEQDLYWESDDRVGRERLLEVLVDEARKFGWAGDFDDSWSDCDIKLLGDRWHEISIRTATEELAWPRRFTRARCAVRATFFAKFVAVSTAIWLLAAVLSWQIWPVAVGLLIALGSIGCFFRSRRRCLRAVTALVWRAGMLARLGRPHGEVGETPPHSTVTLDADPQEAAEEVQEVEASAQN